MREERDNMTKAWKRKITRDAREEATDKKRDTRAQETRNRDERRDGRREERD